MNESRRKPRLTSQNRRVYAAHNIQSAHTLYALNYISYSSLRVAHDSAVGSSGLPGPLVWPSLAPTVTRWTKRPLCHLVPGPVLAFHTPPKPVSGTRSRHFCYNLPLEICTRSPHHSLLVRSYADSFLRSRFCTLTGWAPQSRRYCQAFTDLHLSTKSNGPIMRSCILRRTSGTKYWAVG